MKSTDRRAELVAELAKLHDLQMELITNATFAGWTAEKNVEHEQRSGQMLALSSELNALK